MKQYAQSKKIEKLKVALNALNVRLASEQTELAKGFTRDEIAYTEKAIEKTKASLAKAIETDKKNAKVAEVSKLTVAMVNLELEKEKVAAMQKKIDAMNAYRANGNTGANITKVASDLSTAIPVEKSKVNAK